MSIVTIRQGGLQDMRQLLVLWHELMEFHRQRDPFFTRAGDGDAHFLAHLRDVLGKPSWRLLVAERERRLVGYCLAGILRYPGVYERPRFGWIQDFVVTESARRSHVGTRLFEAAADWLRGQGVDRIELEVAVTNEVSTEFWQRQGFEPFLTKMRRPL